MENYDGYLSCQTATCPPLMPFADQAVGLSLSRKTKRADDLAAFLDAAPNLTSVSLHDPRLLDVAPKAASVEELSITGTSLASLEFLAGFPKLRRLKLNPAKLTDLSALEDLPNLERVSISGAKIDRLPDLPVTLVELVAHGCKALTDISGLRGCEALQHVDLNNTKVSDLSPLESAVSLRAIKLRSTKVDNLSPLFVASQLETLYAERTKLKTVEGIGALTNLRLLWLHMTPLADVAPIGAVASLLELDLSGVKASNFGALRSLQNLRFLDVYETDFDDLEVLESLPSLERAKVGKTKLSQRSDSTKALNNALRARHGKEAGLDFGKPDGMPTSLRAAEVFCATGDMEHWQFNLENP